MNTVTDYENRIIDILQDDDITTRFEEMLSIGAKIRSDVLSDTDRDELASRIQRGVSFWGRENTSESLRHVAWLHLLARLTESPWHFGNLISYIGSMDIEARYRYFLLTQARHMMDLKPEIATGAVCREFISIYKGIVRQYAHLAAADLTRLKRQERLPHQVVILTQQYLASSHPPTRACDETARIIMEDLGQDVMIMNTNDLLPTGHVVPLFGIEGHNCMDCLQNNDYTYIEGVPVPFFQPENRMPDPGIIKVILETIRELRPQYIVSIGSFPLVASLAAKMLPVIPMKELRPEDGTAVLKRGLSACRDMIAGTGYMKVIVRV